VPGTKGLMLTFDDFVQGIETFGKHIQSLMMSRASRLKSAERCPSVSGWFATRMMMKRAVCAAAHALISGIIDNMTSCASRYAFSPAM
jgi:hypothetical protein